MASYSEWLREKGLLTAGIFSGQKSKFGLGDLFFGRGGGGEWGEVVLFQQEMQLRQACLKLSGNISIK